MITIEIECDSRFPTQDALRQAFESLVRQATDLWQLVLQKYQEAKKALVDGLNDLYEQLIAEYQQLIQDYEDFIQQIKDLWDLISPYPLSVDDPAYATIESVQDSVVQRARAIVTEYSTFLIQKFLDLIADLIPVSFLVPVPYFGTIDIVALFNDPAYRASLKQQILDDVDAVASAIGGAIADVYSAVNGGVASLEIKAQEIWQYIIQKVTEGGLTLLYDALGALIEEFQDIWDSLGLPDLVALLTLDVESLITSAIESVVAQFDTLIQNLLDQYNAVKELFAKGEATYAELIAARDAFLEMVRDKWQAVIDEILGIGVFNVTVGDIVTLATNPSVDNAEQIVNTLISQAVDWAYKYPFKLILEWMDQVTAFFEEIGLGAILEFLTFTFCDFLDLIGLPVTSPA